jgi:hypothetical protein
MVVADWTKKTTASHRNKVIAEGGKPSPAILSRVAQDYEKFLRANGGMEPSETTYTIMVRNAIKDTDMAENIQFSVAMGVAVAGALLAVIFVLVNA